MATDINGTASGDTLTGDDTGQVIRGFQGNDQLFGNGGDDTLIGGSGYDKLYGGAGKDTLIEDNSADPVGYRGGQLVGGAGDDIYDITWSEAGLYGSFIVSEDLGGGYDTIRLHGFSPENVAVSDRGTFSRLSFYDDSGVGIATVDFTTDMVEEVVDGVKISRGIDFFDRYERIEFDDGTVWDASTGIRFSNRFEGVYTYGTMRGDYFVGGDLDDRLLGFDGDDVFDTSAASDTKIGGYGNDTYIFRVGVGVQNPNIYSGIYEEIGQGYDRLDFVGIAPGDLLITPSTLPHTAGPNVVIGVPDGAGGHLMTNIRQTTLDSLFRVIERFEFDDGTVWDRTSGFVAANAQGGITQAGTTGADVLTGTEYSDFVFGGRLGDFIRGKQGDDYLTGGGGDDTVLGGKGRDTLSGGSGADLLRGGARGDTLYGNNGQDRLVGGAGNDVLYGGPGRDIFVFKGRPGLDSIADFQTGRDVVDLTQVDGFTSYQDVVGALSVLGGSTRLVLNDGSAVVFAYVSIDQLSPSDFLL